MRGNRSFLLSIFAAMFTLAFISCIVQAAPYISFGGGTPADGTIQAERSIFVNVLASDATANVSTFIDFDNSLAGWWRLEGNIYDDSGVNNATSELRGDPGYAAGALGQAMQFDGVDDCLVVNTTSMSNTLGTIGFWFNRKGFVSGADHFDMMLSHFNWTSLTWPSGIGNRVYIMFNSSNGRLSTYMEGIGVYGNYEDPEYIVRDFGNEFGVWHHLALVWDNGYYHVYIDGQLNLTENYVQSLFALRPDMHFAAWDNTGKRFGAQEPNEEFNGSIDDIVVFNRTLNAEEIAGLYANTSSKHLDRTFTGLANGTHTFKAYAQDTIGNVNSTEIWTITIQGIFHTIQLILNIDNLVNYIYVPGTGSIASASIVNTTYSSPAHWYLASYLNNVLNALVFNYQTPQSLAVSRTSDAHSLTVSQAIHNSRSFLVFTSGNWEAIGNRMELIENGEFMNEISPSFAYGLGINYVAKILLSYSNIRMLDNLILGTGYHDMVFENTGISDGKIGLNVSSV